MTKFFRMFARHLKRHVGAGAVLSFSTVSAYQERELTPADRALRLENFQEKFSHKFVLQQSRHVKLAQNDLENF